jgi:hypothetical protein
MADRLKRFYHILKEQNVWETGSVSVPRCKGEDALNHVGKFETTNPNHWMACHIQMGLLERSISVTGSDDLFT